MLSAYHNGVREDLIYLPEYKVYLAVDCDGTNVYDMQENLLGHFDTEAEAREAVRVRFGKGNQDGIL